MSEKYAMLRKTVLIANIIALIIYISPLFFIGLILLKNNDASSAGIIGGADGPTAIFLSSKFPSPDIFPWSIMVILLILNIYVIKKYNKKDK